MAVGAQEFKAAGLQIPGDDYLIHVIAVDRFSLIVILINGRSAAFNESRAPPVFIGGLRCRLCLEFERRINVGHFFVAAFAFVNRLVQCAVAVGVKVTNFD